MIALLINFVIKSPKFITICLTNKNNMNLQPTAYSLQPTAYSLQPTAYSLQPTAYSLQPTA